MNSARQAKRRARYKAYLSSAAWKAKRREVFERDDYRCTARVEWNALRHRFGDVDRWNARTMRCPEGDETRTGVGLVCDHLTYARFGHENLEDLRTLCRSCDKRITSQTRPNHIRRSA